MAIYPTQHSARPSIDAANTTLVDVAAWTQDAIQAMGNMSLNSSPTPLIRGTSIGLHIPLDGDHNGLAKGGDGQGVTAGEAVRGGYVLRRKSSNRDSLRRREELLKGKEGSRQRRRWENDRLMGNPYAEAPLPSDWEIHPTHPVHSVPYYLAPLWDAGYAKQSAARKERSQRARTHVYEGGDKAVGKVPKELKEKLKRSKAAKGLLQGLEEEVRKFVESWEKRNERLEKEGIIEPDSDEDEIVFVGRGGQMHDMMSSQSLDELVEREKLVYDSLEGDHGAGFGRWLVHSIGAYYGLKTWSVTVGNPARREAYVGINEVKLKTGRSKSFHSPLPQPLWAKV